MMSSISINIEVRWQTLDVLENGKLLLKLPMASAKNGIGQVEGSECTPLGGHKIAEKIGVDEPENTVFVGRKATGEVYSETFAKTQNERDWILTRILWLEGLEDGFNKGFFQSDDPSNSQPIKSCDTKQRYIYIHGCPDSHPMQIPSSHGCIKLRNADMIKLFEMVSVGDRVDILR